MKKIVYILLFLLASVKVFSQNDIPPPPPAQGTGETVYTVVEHMPEFPGGMNNMITFLQEYLVYPEAAKKQGCEGKVFVKFVVDSTGKIRNCDVIRGSGTAMLDEEALRVVRTFPRWTPGKQNGKNVNVYFNIPINFKLTGTGKSGKIKDEDYALFYYNLGVKYDSYSQHAYAAEAYEKGLKYDAKDIDALYNLGIAYHKTQQDDKACKTWNLIKEMGKQDADQLINQYCK